MQLALKQESSHFADLDHLFDQAVADGVFPGAVAVVSVDGNPVYQRAVGRKSVNPEHESEGWNLVNPQTVYDVASITNILVTTTLVMKLEAQGVVSLSDRVARYVEGFTVFGKSSISIGDLLSHQAGFPAWLPYFEELARVNMESRLGIMMSRGAADHIYNLIKRSTPKYKSGIKQTYSDIGFILLGHLIEGLSGGSLERASQTQIFSPLKMRSTGFVNLALIKRKGISTLTEMIAPTEECAWRKRMIWGEVHDDNAWAMGGIAGHSGVFSTAQDLQIFGDEMIRAYRGESSFLPADIVQRYFAGPREGAEIGYRYGWDSPSRENSMQNSGLSSDAVGLNSFTGCSLWLEPKQGIAVVLLSNRIHPSRNNRKIREFREKFHSTLLNSISGL